MELAGKSSEDGQEGHVVLVVSEVMELFPDHQAVDCRLAAQAPEGQAFEAPAEDGLETALVGRAPVLVLEAVLLAQQQVVLHEVVQDLAAQLFALGQLLVVVPQALQIILNSHHGDLALALNLEVPAVEPVKAVESLHKAYVEVQDAQDLRQVALGVVDDVLQDLVVDSNCAFVAGLLDNKQKLIRTSPQTADLQEV